MLFVFVSGLHLMALISHPWQARGTLWMPGNALPLCCRFSPSRGPLGKSLEMPCGLGKAQLAAFPGTDALFGR